MWDRYIDESNPAAAQLYFVSNLTVAAVVEDAKLGDVDATAVVWVTDSTTGAPVVNATVHLYAAYRVGRAARSVRSCRAWLPRRYLE